MRNISFYLEEACFQAIANSPTQHQLLVTQLIYFYNKSYIFRHLTGHHQDLFIKILSEESKQTEVLNSL